MFHFINTHYDDAGIIARAESSWLIRRYAHDYVEKVNRDNAEDPSAPVILLGDFSEYPCAIIPLITLADNQTHRPKRQAIKS